MSDYDARVKIKHTKLKDRYKGHLKQETFIRKPHHGSCHDFSNELLHDLQLSI